MTSGHYFVPSQPGAQSSKYLDSTYMKLVYFHLLQEGNVCLLYLKLPPPVPTSYTVLTDYRGGSNSVVEIPETMLKTIVLLLMFISFSWSSHFLHF